MSRVFVIENPAASCTTASGLARIMAALRSAGLSPVSSRTSGPGDASRLAAEAIRNGFEVIAVYGGDGTAMNAVAGMRGSGAALGLIPGGTGNLLAGNLRIPRDPARAAALIAEGEHRRIDLIRLQMGGGSRLCAVGAGTGYDADMMAGTTTAQKRRWGRAAYVGFVVRTAHRVRPEPVTITVDGERTEELATSVIVANCAEILPPYLRLGPEVAIDDGILDVVILEARGFFSAGLTALDLLRLRQSPRVRRLRGRQVRIERPEPRPVQADGDLCGLTPFEARILPGELAVIAPQ